MPEHELYIKPNMLLILLRNLNPREGLANGTRLLALGLHARGKLLKAKIISGSAEHRGRVVLIPRIDLIADETLYPFKWARRQFPVRAAFALTINKAQGQSLRRVGVFLNEACFAHGQLYVTCSRVGTPDDLRFVLRRDAASGRFLTRNVVYQEALTASTSDPAPLVYSATNDVGELDVDMGEALGDRDSDTDDDLDQ